MQPRNILETATKRKWKRRPCIINLVTRYPLIYDQFWDFLLARYFLDSCTLMHGDTDASKALIITSFLYIFRKSFKYLFIQFEIIMVWVEKYWFFQFWSHRHFYMQIQTISGPITWKKSGFGLKSGKNKPNWSTDNEIGFFGSMSVL